MTYTADLQQRNFYSLGLLSLAALPWISVAPILPVLLAVLLAWGSRQLRGARQYAIYSSVYAAGVVLVLPPFDLAQALFTRLEPFFIVLVLGYLLGAALDGIQDGTFWAWLAPLLLFLGMPSAWGAAAILGLALLAALEKQQGVVGNRSYSLERQHIWVLSGLIVLVAAMGLMLPRVGVLQDPTSTLTPPPPDVIAKPQKPPELITSGVRKAVNPSRSSSDEGLYASTTALLYVMVVLLAMFLWRSKLEAKKKNPNNSLWDFMPIVAILVLATVILAFALNAPPNIPDGMEQPLGFPEAGGLTTTGKTTPPKAAEATSQNSSRGLSAWLPYLMAGLALIVLFLWLRGAKRQFALSPEPLWVIPNPIPSQAATNRVRQAYLAFLEYTTRQGMPRMVAETPLEFVLRYGEKFPLAVAAAQTLTNLYEPVRYGQLAAETHAREAETALEQITRN